MFWLKSCPRCAGDLTLKEDIYGKEVLCVQCGFRPSPVSLSQLRRRAPEPEHAAVPAVRRTKAA